MIDKIKKIIQSSLMWYTLIVALFESVVIYFYYMDVTDFKSELYKLIFMIASIAINAVLLMFIVNIGIKYKVYALKKEE